MGKPESVDVTLDLKFMQISGTWRPNDAERKAAWELYVELVTRVGVVPLRDGLLRETLTSFYSIFGTTREILRKYGPDVAEPKPDGQYNFGYLSVAVLNYTLRPLLTYWHPELEMWETQARDGSTMSEHERQSSREPALREAIAAAGEELRAFVNVLAQACNVPSLIQGVPSS